MEKEPERTLEPENRQQSGLQFTDDSAGAGKHVQFINDKHSRNQCHEQAGSGHQVAGRSESVQQSVQRNAGILAEAHENRNLNKKGERAYQQNHKHIHHSFAHYRAHQSAEADSILSVKHTATQHFAHTGHNQTACVTEIYGMNAAAQAHPAICRSKHLAPTQGAENLSQHTKRQAQKHPSPGHVLGQCGRDLFPLESPVHPPQDGNSKNNGQNTFNGIIDEFLHYSVHNY